MKKYYNIVSKRTFLRNSPFSLKKTTILRLLRNCITSFTSQTLLLLCLFSNPIVVHAFSGDATDAAFAALLSQRGAEPQTGYWDFEIPEDFMASNEDELIVYLAKQQKAGADFNAYRHFGTLLHHAIRAGQEKTAIWLLNHGADSNKKLQSNSANVVQLSFEYKRESVLAALKQKLGADYVAKYTPKPYVYDDGKPKLPKQYKSDADYAATRAVLNRLSWYDSYSKKKRLEQYAEAKQSWDKAVAAMPKGVYEKLMDDDNAITSLVHLHSQSADNLSTALKQLPPRLLQQHKQAALRGLLDYASMEIQYKKPYARSYTISPDIWQALWGQLPKPLDYTNWPNAASKIQPELWSALYASGYQNHDAETALVAMLSSINADEFKAIWPKLKQYFSNINEVAPVMVLGGFRLITNDRYYSYRSIEDVKQKVLFLTSIGIQQKVNGLNWRELQDQPADFLAAIRPFIPDATPLPAPRLVDAANANCTFKWNDVWRKALMNRPMTSKANGDPVYIDTLQLIAIPNEAGCGLLVGGVETKDYYIGGDFDNFNGPDSEPRRPCAADPTDHYEIWYEHQGKIRYLQTGIGNDGGDANLISVQDAQTKKLYFLHQGYGVCGGISRQLPKAFEWQITKGQRVLVKSELPTINEALYSQCSITAGGLLSCRGISALTPKEHEEPTPQDATNPLYLYDFIKFYGKYDYDAFMLAIMQYDKASLKRIRAQGLFASWVGEAIEQVSKSALNLAEKRQRIAWLFYDHALLTHSGIDYDKLENLLKWLPKEDWKPLIATGLISREILIANGMQKTACDLDHAAGLMCNEKWGSGSKPEKE